MEQNNQGNRKIPLSALIGIRIKHLEQNYTGVIKTDLRNGYCMVDLDSLELKKLYPFGVKAKLDKLVYYI